MARRVQFDPPRSRLAFCRPSLNLESLDSLTSIEAQEPRLLAMPQAHPFSIARIGVLNCRAMPILRSGHRVVSVIVPTLDGYLMRLESRQARPRPTANGPGNWASMIRARPSTSAQPW